MKEIRNLFSLKKEINDTVKYKRNLFRLKKENKAIKEIKNNKRY